MCRSPRDRHRRRTGRRARLYQARRRTRPADATAECAPARMTTLLQRAPQAPSTGVDGPCKPPTHGGMRKSEGKRLKGCIRAAIAGVSVANRLAIKNGGDFL